MNDPLLLLTPLIVLVILALFRFTGCTPFGSTEPSGKVEGPPLVGVPPPGPPPPPPTYADVIAGTAGFAAHWPLNETGGNVAQALGPLSATAEGTYEGTGYALGKPGIPLKDGSTNRAPEFPGTTQAGAFLRVPFNSQLNTLTFSVELWVKPNPALGGTTQVLVSSRRVDQNQGFEIALLKVPGEAHQMVRGRVFSGGTAGMTEVTFQPKQGDPDAWRYILLSFDNGSKPGSLTLRFRLANSSEWFKDGPQDGVYGNVTSAAPATWRFGAGHTTGQAPNNFFAGLIDEAAFYNAVLADEKERNKRFAMIL